jgi:tripartite-type tricarboxylate transporter receptor subunit TctC
MARRWESTEMTCNRRVAIAAIGGALLESAHAKAQAWPTRPLRIVVVYPPGGISDVVARGLADRLSVQLGVQVLVENRSGGGGGLGIESLSRAEPDGYTLAFSAVSPLTVKPHLERVRYDPFKDIEPVAAVMHTPVLVVGTPAVQGRDFKDLLLHARSHPGSLRWASSGIATTGHLVLEHVKSAARVDITHIPYKGGGQQIADALAGEFEILSTNLSLETLRHVRDGRFKALALGAPERASSLPDTPTFSDLGMPQANLSSLFGLFTRAGTPVAILSRLNEEIKLALAHPDLVQRLHLSDNVRATASRAEFAREIASQWHGNLKLKELGIRID